MKQTVLIQLLDWDFPVINHPFLGYHDYGKPEMSPQTSMERLIDAIPQLKLLENHRKMVSH